MISPDSPDWPWWAAESRRILAEAIDSHRPTHVFALFSGGHDSLCSTYVAAQHPQFTAAVHLNTGRGIEATHDYVRATCGQFGWPLLEYFPDGKSYEALARERGMPAGPKAHNTQYYWLKQRSIRRLVREHKRGKHDRIVLVTGIRTAESRRRMAADLSVPVRRDGAQVWVNPLLDWDGLNIADFIRSERLPRNPVVERLHRSGECLCGALAQPRELAYIELFYPQDVAPIRALERECAANGLPSVWGMRESRISVDERQQRLPLCWTCDARLTSP